MITARLAEGYDRSVMAIPGRIGDTMSEGTNRLIASERARMVCSGEDIARELMWDIHKSVAAPVFDLSVLSPGAQKLLTHIREGETISIDGLACASEMSVAELAPLLFELECEGAVRMLPGKLYEKA